MKPKTFKTALLAAALCPMSILAIVPVTGVHTGTDPETGFYPPRLRIQDLEQNGPQWDLYIQAMIEFQAVPEDDELSYFAISGIHGRPYVSWSGVEQVDDAPLTGYCTHNEVLFAIWHRPLVAVFEQALARHVQSVASRYTGDLSETYRKAADAWRHPYWDWAIDKALPDAVVRHNVTVNMPSSDGTLLPTTLENPLRRYRFHQFSLNTTLFPPDADDDYHLSSYPETLRCPDPNNNFSSTPGMASANIAGIDLAAQVYNVYTRIKTFAQMSSTACDSTSFEQQHNEVHVAVGGLHPMGHFAHLGFSGFDPLFMMHHAAIDRHVALWQAIYFDEIGFEPYTSVSGQFSTAPGTNITMDSPLKPFYQGANVAHKTKGDAFHTSRSAWDISTFGYSYPELLDSQAKVTGLSVILEKKKTLSRSIKTTINKLYGPNLTTISIGSHLSKQRQSYKAYFVRVSVEKHGLQLPATVSIYLGNEYKGRVVLLPPGSGRVYGEVSLHDEPVSQNSKLTDEYIRSNLYWKVASFSGEIFNASSIDVNITVIKQDVMLPSSLDKFPVYTDSHVIEAN